MSWRRRDSTSRLYELPVGVLPGDLVARNSNKSQPRTSTRSYIGPFEATAGGRHQAERVQHQLPARLSG